MFYVAKEMLINEDFTSNKHEGIVANFGRYFVLSGKVDRDFQKYLTDGQKKRSQSDYDLEVDFDEQEAEAQIEHAEKFIAMGEQYFNPPTTNER
jgi:uncharacterized protein (UPF0332 family)